MNVSTPKQHFHPQEHHHKTVSDDCKVVSQTQYIPARWPEIITAIALQHGKVINFENLDWEEKCELLRLNPVTAALMFDHRVSTFIKEIIKSPVNPIGRVKDYFYRVEFQARGSPHIHCLFWIENAPKYGQCPDEEFISFVDKYTTCRLPNKEDEPELFELVSRVQTHSKNHTKTRRKGKSECRFGFPKPPSRTTFIVKPSSNINCRVKETCSTIHISA